MGRPCKEKKDKAHPNDIIKCEICKKCFTRSNRSKHNKTTMHQIYVKLNDKARAIIHEKKLENPNILTAEDLSIQSAKADFRERLKSKD